LWLRVRVNAVNCVSPNPVNQTGNTCILYAPLNLLIMAGHKYSQDEADATVFGMLEFLKWDSGNDNEFGGDWLKWSRARWEDDWDMGNYPRHLRAMFEAEGVWPRIAGGQFSVMGANGESVFDRQAAERYLMATIGKGNPVLVTTATQGILSVNANLHAYNIIGVRTDNSGRLTSVLASTNSSEVPFVEIPAEAFMNAWAETWGTHAAMKP
jgi:hypothetical protein